MQTIHRNYLLTEHDDFVLNVQDICGNTQEAIPFYHEGNIIFWTVKTKFE